MVPVPVLLGNNVNLASPGPIGGTTPNTGAFTVLNVGFYTGGITFGTGTVLGTGASIASVNGSAMRARVSGAESWAATANGFQIAQGKSLIWSGSSGDVAATGQTFLTEEAANTLAMRNGTNAQGFRVSNTWANAGTDFERGVFDWQTTANTLTIGTQKGGTGATRGINFVVGSTISWQLNTSGHLVAGTDNTFDIGAAGATRPRHLYLAGNLHVQAGLLVTTPANGGAVGTGGTVATGTACSRVQPAAAVTGVILQAGTVDGQTFTLVNESTAANTITMAVAATSNVADGTSTVINGLNAARFTWCAGSARWFR